MLQQLAEPLEWSMRLRSSFHCSAARQIVAKNNCHRQTSLRCVMNSSYPTRGTVRDRPNLVALNRTSTAEEAHGKIRWLRPEYRNAAGQAALAQGEQTAMDIGPAVSTDKAAWLKTLPEHFAAVSDTLQNMGEATPDHSACTFPARPLCLSAAPVEKLSRAGPSSGNLRWKVRGLTLLFRAADLPAVQANRRIEVDSGVD